MMILKSRLVFTFLLTAVVSSCFSFSNSDLRGWSEKSTDGRTYFVVDDLDAGTCPPIYVDGLLLPVKVGEKAEIAPGIHKVSCGNQSDLSQGAGFDVKEGSTYHFHYWGL